MEERKIMKEIQITNEIGYVEMKPLSNEAQVVLDYYTALISVPLVVAIGSQSHLSPIHKDETPPIALREYIISYPPSLIAAYKIVCNTYDKAFMELVKQQKEHQTDYQYGSNTLAFQVDGPAY